MKITSLQLPGRLLVAFLLCCLAGCAAVSTTEKKTDPKAQALWQSREAVLRSINGWAVKARLAIKTADDGWTASLHWAQKGRLYKMRIIAPLGQGTFEIRGGHGKVVLLTAENEEYEASDPDTLMDENLGWSVPVLGMQYWVLGLTDPDYDIDAIDIDSMGRIDALEQAGWTIDFDNYKHVDSLELPGKITMENDRIRIRLVIQEWVRVI